MGLGRATAGSARCGCSLYKMKQSWEMREENEIRDESCCELGPSSGFNFISRRLVSNVIQSDLLSNMLLKAYSCNIFSLFLFLLPNISSFQFNHCSNITSSLRFSFVHVGEDSFRGVGSI